MVMTTVREMLQWSNASHFYTVKPTMTCWDQGKVFTAEDLK